MSNLILWTIYICKTTFSNNTQYSFLPNVNLFWRTFQALNNFIWVWNLSTYVILHRNVVQNDVLLHPCRLLWCLLKKLKGEAAELVRSRLFLGLFHEHENGAVKSCSSDFTCSSSFRLRWSSCFEFVSFWRKKFGLIGHSWLL